jgi:Cu(I)/Ag(I) efflux system membrane fusion protein
MKRLAWTAVAVLGIAVAATAGYFAGSRPHSASEGASQAAGTGERKILYYRNPMGLPDTSPVPKKDPMGMDYIPVFEGEDNQQSGPAGSVRIPTDKQQLLGVRTETALERELTRTIRAVGTIQANERLLYKVTSRFEGWIETLHVNTTGQAVSRGEPLMEVYSPELVSAQEEYVIALRAIEQSRASGAEAQAVMQRLSESALNRMRNFGISEAELATLRKEGKGRRTLVLRSPVPGVVTAKTAVQGARFMPGETLYEIADLSTVWLVAEVAERDLGLVKLGQKATLRISAYPDRTFEGKVVFVQPTLEAETRTARVRVELPNRGAVLKPAMYGEAELAAAHVKGKVLAIPESAILDSGTRRAVLVQREPGLFEPREVKLGMRADGYAEVLEGVKSGEEIVVRANFLIDAESNLKAALSGFATPAQTHRGTATVQAVDSNGGMVELDHGPIPTLNWPAMKMEFSVADKAALRGLRPGDHVEFELAPKAEGVYEVRSIKKGH